MKIGPSGLTRTLLGVMTAPVTRIIPKQMFLPVFTERMKIGGGDIEVDCDSNEKDRGRLLQES